VKRAEREAVLKQGVVRPETPAQRRQAVELRDDLRSSPVLGQPLPLRLRNFRPTPDSYLGALGGPRPYMLRLNEIERLERELVASLDSAWLDLAAECGGDQAIFGQRWSAAVEAWNFDEVNELIERHNRWFPAESRLPMDPRRRDYALVNGRDFRRDPLGPAWALSRFPAVFPATADAS
jgi:hypothetical protein